MPTPMVIDLSHWNTVTDFAAMKKKGIVGIIHKATEGASVDDDTYEDRKKDALAAGLLWGAYHFLRPGDMQKQAKFFVDVAGDIDIYAADHEDPAVSLNDLKDFLQEVEALTGKSPIVYSGHVIKEQVDNNEDDELAQYKLWLAQYTSGTPSWPTKIWPDYWLWQYTDEGTMSGIQGYCDLNQYQGPPEQLKKEWTGEDEGESGEEPAPPPETAEQAIVTIKIKTKGNVRVKLIAENDVDIEEV